MKNKIYIIDRKEAGLAHPLNIEDKQQMTGNLYEAIEVIDDRFALSSASVNKKPLNR